MKDIMGSRVGDGNSFEKPEVEHILKLLEPVREKFKSRLAEILACKKDLQEAEFVNSLILKSAGNWGSFQKLRDDSMVEIRSLCGLLSGLGHDGEKLSLGCLISSSLADEESAHISSMLDRLIYPVCEEDYFKAATSLSDLSYERQRHFKEQEHQWNLWFSAKDFDKSTSDASDNTHFKVCAKCYDGLSTSHKNKTSDVPWQALINDSWQGIVPPELQTFTHEFDGPLQRFGLTIIELSMICLYNPITFLKMLPSGTSPSLYSISFLENESFYVIYISRW
jgi:hypothetical protein